MRNKKLSSFIEWGVLVFPFLGLFLFCGFQATFNRPRKENTLVEQIPIRTKSMYVATTKGLRLREAPNVESKNIITIPNGQLVTILESENTIQTINDTPTLCKRERSNLCFGIGDIVKINGLYGRWSEVRWKEYNGYAFDGYLMEEDDFLLKKAIEKILSISLQPFSMYGNRVFQEYKETIFKVAIRKELESEKYRVITLSPNKDYACEDYSRNCLNIVLDRNNKILFISSEPMGSVIKIKEKSILFNSYWSDAGYNGIIYEALRLSNWRIYTKDGDHYYDEIKEISPTPEIEELFE